MSYYWLLNKFCLHFHLTLISSSGRIAATSLREPTRKSIWRPRLLKDSRKTASAWFRTECRLSGSARDVSLGVPFRFEFHLLEFVGTGHGTNTSSPPLFSFRKASRICQEEFHLKTERQRRRRSHRFLCRAYYQSSLRLPFCETAVLLQRK